MIRLYTVLALLVGASHAAAATLDWPGSGACSTTLQACIDSAGTGDTIEIVTEGVINESPSILNRSLTLTKRGAAALFAPGRSLLVQATNNGIEIAVSNLFLDGGITINVGSSEAAHTQSISIDGVRTGNSTVFNAISINETTSASSAYTITIRRSKLFQANPAGAGIFLTRDGGSAKPTLNVLNNEIQVRGSGIAAEVAARDGTVLVNGNRIGRLQSFPTGATLSAGVFVNGLGGGPTPATVRITRNTIYNVDIGAFVNANSASLAPTLVNNTIARTNLSAISLGREGALTMTGRVANNIVHRAASCGLEFRNTGIAVTHDFNQYSVVGSAAYCGTTAGANDRTALAAFRGQFDFRAPNSAASQVNVGSNADQPQIVFVIVPVPLPDIDGRAGRVGANVDIGAHEFSVDQSFEHASLAGNTSTNLTRVVPANIGLIPSDVLTLSHYGRPIDGVTPLPAGAANHTGVWYSTSNNLWNIFNQNSATSMPLNRRFFVLLNVDAQVSYVHTATAGNTGFNLTKLDHPQLNNQPDALPIVTQHWDPTQSGSGIYNNSSIGVWYDTAINRWRIFNQLPSGGGAPPMPVGAAFNVLIPNPLFAAGSHAFRTTPLGVPVGFYNLSHPLLDNTACAHPFVTAVYNPNNVYVPGNLLLSYNDASAARGNWAIERGDGAQIPAGAAFHVYIDPEQSRRCQSEPLLIDGFE
jgi:hypothetical protein